MNKYVYSTSISKFEATDFFIAKINKDSFNNIYYVINYNVKKEELKRQTKYIHKLLDSII